MTHVLNTRPAHQADSLTIAIEQLGGTVFHLPLFEIERISFLPVDFSQMDFVIFISRNAVDSFFENQSMDFDFPGIIAIGSATQKALHERGIKKIICPETFNSEAVLSLPDLQLIENKKIAIICGENTKPLLAQTLKKRLAQVNAIVCYRRKNLYYDMKQWMPKLLSANINLVVVTSLKSYFALLSLFQKPEYRNWLLQKTICVIHDKMKKQAKQDGFSYIVCAQNPTTESITSAIKESAMSESRTSSSSIGAYWISFFAVIMAVAALLVCVWNLQSSVENKFDQKSQALQIQQIQQIVAQSQKTGNSELTYLVHLANMQLVIGRDPVAAIKTLRLAEKGLSPIQIGMTNALNEDIAQLQSVATVDKDSIFSSIALINRSIQSLTAIPSKPINAVEQKSAVTPVEKNWRDRITDQLASLKKLFIIRQVNESVRPLFDAQLEFSVKQNLYLQLSLAQWGLVHHNAKIYQTSLQIVYDDLTRYFSLTNETKPILDKIITLQKINVDPALPSLENTMMLLGPAHK